MSFPLNVSAIAVDLDGTLLHSAPELSEAANRMLLDDALAAHAAGCPVFCVSYGYNHGEPASSLDTDAVIADLPAALTLINRI